MTARHPCQGAAPWQEPRIPNSTTDGETEAQWGKALSRSFRGMGTGTKPGHVHHTHPHVCSNTYTLAPLCTHTHSRTGTSRQEGPHPSSPPLGTPIPCPVTFSGPRDPVSSTPVYVKGTQEVLQRVGSGTPIWGGGRWGLRKYITIVLYFIVTKTLIVLCVLVETPHSCECKNSHFTSPYTEFTHPASFIYDAEMHLDAHKYPQSHSKHNYTHTPTHTTTVI